MSRASSKSAGGTSKATAPNRKKTVKSVKSARKAVKKPGASASRRGTAKPARRSAVAKRSAAPKTVSKPLTKSGEPAATTPAMAAFIAQAAVLRTASRPMQPAAQVVVHAHRFRVGETVYYTSPSFGRAAATGSYTVVKLLPSEGDDYQYRIKSSGEAFERVAKESQLDRA